MTSIEPARIAQGRAMLLAGLRRHHTFADGTRTIAAQWDDFNRLGPPPGRQGTAAYGVICGADPDARTMEYLCGVEVAALEPVPPEYGRVRILPQRYAVFTHQGNVSTVRRTWDAIFGDWLPRSGCRSANAPDFELYDERFDPATGEGVIEIWVPIQAE